MPRRNWRASSEQSASEKAKETRKTSKERQKRRSFYVAENVEEDVWRCGQPKKKRVYSERSGIVPPRTFDVRRPSDRKCKVVGTDTRTMRRYASLQYYIKYCFIHLPTPCPSSTSPQLRSTFDAVSWDDFCQMGVQLYLDSTTSEHLASRTCVKAPN